MAEADIGILFAALKCDSTGGSHELAEAVA